MILHNAGSVMNRAEENVLEFQKNYENEIPNILIVDDNIMDLKVIKEALTGTLRTIYQVAIAKMISNGIYQNAAL